MKGWISVAIQTTIDQPAAQTKVEVETLPTQRTTESLTYPQQGAQLGEVSAVDEAEAAQPASAAGAVPRSTIMIATATTLVAAGFFGYGLVSSRVMPALRRLVISAEEVRVPVLLPVTLAETVWEVLVDRRAVSAAAGRRQTR